MNKRHGLTSVPQKTTLRPFDSAQGPKLSDRKKTKKIKKKQNKIKTKTKKTLKKTKKIKNLKKHLCYENNH